MAYFRCSSGSGGSGGDFSFVDYKGENANANITFSGLTAGKKYLIDVMGVSSNQSHATGYGEVSNITNCTYTEIRPLSSMQGESNSHVATTLFQCVPTSTSITIQFKGSTSTTNYPRQVFLVELN